MLDVLVFDHIRALDLYEVRSALVRVPEVLRLLIDAEEQFMELGGKSVDLLNFVSSDDGIFLRSLTQKTLASALVHFGLFQRMRRSLEGKDLLLLGPINGNSPVPLMTGASELGDFIRTYVARGMGRGDLQHSGLPRLTGVELPQFGMFHYQAGEWVQVGGPATSPQNLVSQAKLRFDLARSVGIGVSNPLDLDFQQLGMASTTSVALDERLQWVWEVIKGPDTLDLAN